MILIGEKFHARFVLASHAGVLSGLSRVREDCVKGHKNVSGRLISWASKQFLYPTRLAALKWAKKPHSVPSDFTLTFEGLPKKINK